VAAPVLVFDIETIPDVAGLRLLRGMPPETSDDEVWAAEVADRASRNKGDFMPHHLQRVVVASCVFRNHEGLRVHSLVDRGAPADPRASQEGRVVQSFFNLIERHEPQLVSWNGSGFDLPVLHHRGLVHGVCASKYWDLGEEDREYKYNNYIGRYHTRHVDLMDLLAMYGRGPAPLDAMAKLCGFPGKLGMDGSQVFPAYREGRLDEIRRYCETDVMNTYLLWCRFQRMRGGLGEQAYAEEIRLVQETCAALAEPHWDEYLKAWPGYVPPAPTEAEAAAAEAEPATAVVVETTTTTTEVYIDASSIAR
jgi:predicted PolB exonuclease-like 3'-5' exonuclease